MNNVQIMSTSPQAGTSKVSVKSTSVSKTAKSSGFDDVLQRSQAQDAKASAQDVKSAVSDARDAAESAADETEASAAAAAAEKNPAAAKTKAKGKDAKQGTKNDDASDVKDDAAAITDDGTDILAEAAQAALDAKLVLAQAVVGNENGVQDVTVTAAETAGSVEDIAQALLDASSSTPSAQSSLQTLVPQDASKGQAQKAMLAMLSGQNVETEAASDMTAATTQQAPQAQNLQNAVQMPQTQTSASMQQLLAQMSPVTDASQTSQQSLAELQSLSSLNTANLAQQAQTLSQQAAASTNDTQTVKTSDFANLLGTDVTHASASDLTLTQQVVAAPQNSGSSLGDFLKGSSQQPGQAMTEMLQTSDGTESVTQLPEEAAFDKGPLIHEEDVIALESAMDAIEERLPKLTSFLIPGDTPAGACLDHARTVVRRAERRFCELAEHEDVHGTDRRFLNRLSDYAFLLMRLEETNV